MKRRYLVLVALCMVLYIVPVNLSLSSYVPTIPGEQYSTSDLQIGEKVLIERGTQTYLGNGTYSYSTQLGEYNTFDGLEYVRYLYDDATHNATFAGHSLVLYDWYATFSNRSQVLVDDMRWIVQYWQDQAGGRWAELDLYDHSFLTPVKGDVLQFGQRFTDGGSTLDIWYFIRNNDSIKILLNFTAGGTDLYRFQWQLTGVDGEPQLTNKSMTFDDVNIGWGDTDLNASYEWFVSTKKLDITFDNLTIGAGETYTLDPSVNPVVGADTDDDTYISTDSGASYTHATGYTTIQIYNTSTFRYYAQCRFPITIDTGSTIDSANLSVYENYDTSQVGVIRRINELNVGSLEGDASRPVWANTTFCSWTTAGDGAGEWSIPFDVTDLIQEQIDLGGWTSGYYIGFILQDNINGAGFVKFNDYQMGSNPAYLNITYTVSGGNTAPSNDGATLTNADDTDNLYAVYKEYIFTSNSSDADGFADIDYIELSLYSAGAYWTCRYDEDTDTFSEEVGASYITLGGSSSASESSNDIDITWYIQIEWAHGSVDNYDLRLYTVDDETESDTDDYDLNYDVICEVDITTGPTLYDEAGTQDRGDYDTVGGIVANGTIDYYSSAISPASDEVDVWIVCNDVASSPWSDLTLTDGTFEVSIDSDDVVGLDTYTFKVVIEGAGSGGSDLCHASETDTYIADRMYIVITADDDTVVNGTQVNFTVSVVYDYDDTAFNYWNITVTNDGGFFGVFNHASTNFNDTDESTTNVYTASTFNNETTHIITEFYVVSESVTWYPEGSPPTTPTTNASAEINYLEELFLSTEIWGLFGVLAIVTLGFIVTTKYRALGIIWFIGEVVIASMYFDLVGDTPAYWWQIIILLFGGLFTWLGPLIANKR